MEKGFNRMVIFFVFLILALIIIFSSLLYRNITTKGIHMSYIYPEDPIPATKYTLLSLGSFFLLYNQFIPLAVIIQMDVIKAFMAVVVWNDAELVGYDHYNKKV